MNPIIPPPVQGLVAALAIWLIDRWFPDFAVSFPGQRPAAALMGGCGVLIDIISVSAFFRAKTTVNPLSPENTQSLVVTGFYQLSRNPMYLGMLMILMAVALWIGNLAGLIPVAIFVISITQFQIKPEERVLEAKFGEDYLAYKTQVRRWI